MPNIVIPNINAYGNSFADTYGGNLGEAKTRGMIDSSALNIIEGAASIEFNEFEKRVRDYILASLGAPVIKVELAAPQLKIAIDAAITKINYHIPYWCTQFCSFQTVGGVNVYELPPYILQNLVYVVYKKSLLATQNIAGTLEFDFFIKYFQDNFLFNEFSIGEFYLLQSHLEMVRKVLGMDGSWDIVGGKYLQLYPMPIMNEEVIIEYRAIDTDTIQPAYRLWISQYATAVAKGILGRILRKYKHLPSPAGGAELDGPELIADSKEEILKLEQELKDAIEEPPLISWY